MCQRKAGRQAEPTWRCLFAEPRSVFTQRLRLLTWPATCRACTAAADIADTRVRVKRRVGHQGGRARYRVRAAAPPPPPQPLPPPSSLPQPTEAPPGPMPHPFLPTVALSPNVYAMCEQGEQGRGWGGTTPWAGGGCGGREGKLFAATARRPFKPARCSRRRRRRRRPRATGLSWLTSSRRRRQSARS